MLNSLVEEVAPLKIDALVMEGTHFGSKRPPRKTEYQLESEIVEHIKSSPGLALASFSPIDLDRLVTYLKAAMKSRRTFVADAYTAFAMHLLHREIGLPNPKSADCMRVYFNCHFEKRGSQKLKDLFAGNRIRLDEIKASPKKFVLCFRPSNLRLDFDGQLPKQSRVLYSYWHGYLGKPDWMAVQDQVDEIGGDFIKAHTSGHIYVEDIIKFVTQIDAKKVIPIHTFKAEAFTDYFEVQLVADRDKVSI